MTTTEFPFDLEEELSQIRNFFKEHTAFELVPESGKVVVIDVGLTITQAFNILKQNGITSAPLWDSMRLDFVGMLTVSDFIDMFIEYGNDSIAGGLSLSEWLEKTPIRDWRKWKSQKQKALKTQPSQAQLSKTIDSTSTPLPPENPANITIGLFFKKNNYYTVAFLYSYSSTSCFCCVPL